MAKSTSIATKAKNTLSNTGKSIANNPKTSLYIGVGIVAILGVYFLYDSLSGLVSKNDPNAGGGNINPNNPGSVPIGATITKAQAEYGASELLAAMDSVGQLSTTEFNRVKNVFRNRNAVDVALLSEAFGMPRRNPVTGEEAPWGLGEKLNLLQWLSIETKDWQKAQLREMIPSVFK
jgi:hypothetical protein